MWSRRGADLVWESLPATHAVFDPDTGETHFLTELPALVLQAISPVPASAAELVQRLAGNVQLDEDSAESVHSAVYQLEQAGLIEFREHQAE
jgi:PqqD family protein of HPr-rel-A system